MKLRILALLVGGVAAFAQNQDALTNETIIRMVASGVPTATVIKTIQLADSVAFRFLPGDLQQLSQYKVPDDIVKAMAARDKAAPTPASARQPPAATAYTPDPKPRAAAIPAPPTQQAPKVQPLQSRDDEPAPASAQDKSRQDWDAVNAIFVDALGQGELSTVIRDKIINRLATSGRFQVVSDPTKADAVLTGSVSEAAVNRYSNGTGGTRFDATAAVRVVTKDQKILWVSEAKNGGFARSASSSVADRIVKDLLKAASPPKKKK
jgi:Lipopolysaccharide-assembly